MPFCNLVFCQKEIVGVGVGLADFEDMTYEWDKGPFVNPFHGEKGSGVILHPVCFLKVFEELTRQEIETVLTIIVAPIGDLLVMGGN